MTAARLDEHVRVRGRFARSVRLDRETERASQLDGYLPTARSLEVIRRIVNGMLRDDGSRAFSITGPYGSGKSSLALFLDALLGARKAPAHQAAVALLNEHDPATADQLEDARKSMGAGAGGFIRAVITAPQREPITTTVLRALARGARRARVSKDLREQIDEALERATSQKFASPSYHEVRDLLSQLAERKPILLVVDEFGKNLEAYAESGSEGDLYLLQELAEWASGEDRLPLVLMTIQHLAFEAYAADTSAAQRREWAKVQGRFEDISYVDSAAATRGLIAAALEHSTDPEYRALRDVAVTGAVEEADAAGLATVADRELVEACYPLHPSTLLVLPALCARYGQNERTLFSFLSSDEPRSLATFTRETPAIGDLPQWVRLDQVYDYFVESASTFVGASRDANRWVEVETTIRDSHGLSSAQLKVLKVVGVLNLVASAGALRASAELVQFSLAGADDGLMEAREVRQRLAELEQLGLLTYRDFAAEYRIWQGSDFDIPAALTSARRELRRGSVAHILRESMPLRSVVAARHSIKSNVMRAFTRTFADETTAVVAVPDAGDVRDGVLVYALSSSGTRPQPEDPAFPVVVVEPQGDHLDEVLSATIEVAALRTTLDDPALPQDDRAARRELNERLALARQVLEHRIGVAYGIDGRWTWVNPPAGEARGLKPMRGSDALSDVLDEVYFDSPPVAYEAINRAELTSQGAKARRIVLEAALTPSRAREERLGLRGDGPEVGMYRAVLEDSGLHDHRRGFSAPKVKEPWHGVWQHLNRTLREATVNPISVRHVLDELMRPPFGLRKGVATVVLTAGLIHNAHDIAVYEHGTFKPKLDAPMSERMVRNPENFSVKHLASSGDKSKRARTVELLIDEVVARLGVPSPERPTVLSAVLLLLRPFHMSGTSYARRTKGFSSVWDASVDRERVAQTRAVRDALVSTQEPDVLLFEALPQAVGFGPLPASGRGPGAMTSREIEEYVRRVADAIDDIEDAYPSLCRRIADVVLEAAHAKNVAVLAGDAAQLEDVEVVTPAVRTFTGLARMANSLDDRTFAQQVATAVTGTPPSEWVDADIPGYLARIREVAASFRRVAALAHARRARERTDETFDAMALDLSREGGEQVTEVIAVRTRERAQLEGHVTALLETARGVTGDDASAARAVLALVAGRLFEDEPAQLAEDLRDSEQHHA
jgi:ABC-type molybdenum transport system ATPase subunit/photorepair protein PhrA